MPIGYLTREQNEKYGYAEFPKYKKSTTPWIDNLLMVLASVLLVPFMFALMLFIWTFAVPLLILVVAIYVIALYSKW